jgi:hypothetical protein
MVAFLGGAWVLFLAVDIFGVVERDGPMWLDLFNDRPVEWIQWPVLALTAASAGYVGGRLHAGRGGPGRREVGSFLLLFAVAAGLMLVEEAGDVRHAIGDHVEDVAGETILGLPNRFVTDLPYMGLLAAVPLYAVVRYGRHIWAVRPARPHLAAAVGLYAVAAAASTFRDVGRFYFGLGAWIDEHVLGGRFPDIPGAPREWAHFQLVDGVLEETVESLGAILLFSFVLAVAAAVRRGALDGEAGGGPATGSAPPADREAPAAGGQSPG